MASCIGGMSWIPEQYSSVLCCQVLDMLRTQHWSGLVQGEYLASADNGRKQMLSNIKTSTIVSTESQLQQKINQVYNVLYNKCTMRVNRGARNKGELDVSLTSSSTAPPCFSCALYLRPTAYETSRAMPLKRVLSITSLKCTTNPSWVLVKKKKK